MQPYVGTSGYSYKEWKGKFYPDDIAADAMLSHYARHFNTVEINSTFYRMPTEKMLVQWSVQVPARFAFVLKTSRKITHLKRLKNVEEEMSYLLRTVATLGEQLGPMLVQLPPNLKSDVARLAEFLQLVPSAARIAVEFRHQSWSNDAVHNVLRDHAVALVTTDAADSSPHLISTADWGYLRLRRAEYSDAELERWCSRLREQPWSSAFVFFKHEDEGAGPELAAKFMRIWEAG
jgi:uncharacterized protein YecE (DUF72 family)